jgi:serine/threonine-protein kinase
MSHVYLATERQLDRKVVIKVLPPETSATVQTERFAREVQVAASLQHPHIVPLLTAGSAEGMAWYVMPFVEGETLGARIAREGALPVNETLRILRDIVDALAYSHAHGVVHRDIKPDNVLLSGRHALVTDFGVAKAVSASTSGRGVRSTGGIALGTPTYMAPEQAAADPHVDHRADIYSVGVLAYELLTGHPPFQARTPQAMLAAHVNSLPDHISLHRPLLPPTIAATVMRCLEKHPADRWQSAAELATMLDLAGTPSGGMTPVPIPSHPALLAYHSGRDERSNLARVTVLFWLSAIAIVASIFGVTRVFGLPDWVWIGSLVLMLLGFPIVIYTSSVERGRSRRTESGAYLITGPPSLESFFTWRRTILGGLLAIGTLLLAAVGYTVARTFGIGPARTLLSSGMVGSDDRFVLADFTNRTADTTFGTTVTEALRVDLGQSRVVRMLSDRDVATALTRMTLPSGTPLTDSIALDLARREGAKAVITGEISAFGSGYVLTANVLETTTGETRAAVRATAADVDHLLPALNDLSGQLRERIGESLRTIRASGPLEQVTTSSMAALEHYSAGSRVFRMGDYEEAKHQLELAIGIDSNFAMAWRRLAAAEINLNAPTSQIAFASRRAYERRDRLTPVERFLTEASYYQNVEPDPVRAVAAYQAVLDIDPLEQVAVNNIAMAYLTMERFGEAEAVLRRSLATAPNRTIYLNFSDALSGEGKWAANDSVARDAARRLDPAGDTPLTILLNGAERSRDVVRADSLLRAHRDPVTNRVDRDNRRYSNVILHFAIGQHATALAVLDSEAVERAGAEELGSALDDAATRAWELVIFEGDLVEARRTLEFVLRKYPIERIPPTDRPYLTLVDIYAHLGDLEAVRRTRRAYETAFPVAERPLEAQATWDAAEALARGDRMGQIAALRRARQLAWCAHCGLYEEAEAWDRLGQADSARVTLERAVTTIAYRDEYNDAAFYAPALQRLGELYEAKGDRPRAREYYQRFIDRWRKADPALQPRVAAARERLAALGPDEPRNP